MSEQRDYALQDLRRRPYHTMLVLLSISTVVAFSVFLYLFANTLLGVTAYITSLGLSATLRTFFEAFIWGTLVLALVLGVVVVTSTVSLEMTNRRRDIGLMKSIGTTMVAVYDHFMAQGVTLLLCGTLMGLAIGVGLYLCGMAWLSWALPGLQVEFQFPLVQMLAIVVLFLFIGYFAVQKPIYDAVNTSPISCLNPDLGQRVRSVGYLDTFGLAFRIASRSTGRKIAGRRRSLLSLSLSIAIAATLWIGGGVVETTTDAYLTRCMGTNIVAVGDADLLETYYNAMSLLSSPLNGSIEFVRPENMIPASLVEAISDLNGVNTVDQRLIAYEDVLEASVVIFNPTTQEYERLGNDQTFKALVVGLDWKNTVSEWYFEGPGSSGPGDAWIGGYMASTMFVDPLVQRLGVRGIRLNITAYAFDISNGGMVALMSLARMQSLWGVNESNLLLVQLNSYDSQTISQVESLASSYGLSVFLQQEVLDKNLSVVASIWYLLQPLPVMALVSAFLSLVSYLLVSVSSRFRDYLIMKSIGASPLFIIKTMIAEGVHMVLIAGIPALLGAFFFSVYGLVPEASVPSIVFLPTMFVTILLALVLVVVLASIPVYGVFGRPSELRLSEFSV
ncbi:MAG: ABC transporter permease [Candidatus Thorarchaeota archaeon]|nr:ABC transporter permease [Candidatus Thorarchaeota archaeon]